MFELSLVISDVTELITANQDIGIHCVSINIPDIFSRNSRKHYRIFTMFGTCVTEKVSNH